MSLKRLLIAERNQILESWRYFIPRYRRRLESIDVVLDKLDVLELTLHRLHILQKVKDINTLTEEYEKIFQTNFRDLLA